MPTVVSIFDTGISQNIKCDNLIGLPNPGHICVSNLAFKLTTSYLIVDLCYQWNYFDQKNHMHMLVKVANNRTQICFGCFTRFGYFN